MASRPYRTCVLATALILALTACSDGPTGTSADPQRTSGLPEGWSGGAPAGSYSIGLDRTEKRGSAAVYLASLNPTPTGFATITQLVRPELYRGQRVRWTGWVRHRNIGGSGGGLWMRVDGPAVTLGFDNMLDRPLRGSSDWRQVEVVLDVPMNALGIAFGVLLSGPGDLLADDLRLEVVNPDVPTTRDVTGTPSGVDSSTVAGWYGRSYSVPVNLDFEGIAGFTPATADWLGRNAVPFTTVAPGPSDADLEALRQMVGSARIVGMGEATHGTREFFQLKHRVFQFLVRQMGFTHFAIEATWPEANNVNHYVLTGEGDPARLLSSLYFWTWNTQEVRDLIEWMRDWNRTAAPDRRVQFLGFDMQFPGAALDTVSSFIGRVDAASASFATGRMACLAPFRNHGATSGQPTTAYAALPADARAACRAALQEVIDRIRSRRAEYERASSTALYENALRSARVVQQFEEMASLWSTGNSGPLARDRFMAENTQWLLDQAGPSARMMLWAHNYHVSRVQGAMGQSLGQAFGNRYVNLGFLFGRGGLNAVGSTSRVLQTWEAALVPNFSIESIFLGTGQPRLLFDTRLVAAGGVAARPLSGPILMRSIGAVFDPAVERNFFATQVFPGDFDLLIYVAQTTPSVLLPFVR